VTVRLNLRSIRDETRVLAVGVTLPSGQVWGFDLDLVSGTDTDGTWQATFELPPAQAGSWSISDVGSIDRLGVWHHLSAGDLARITGSTWTTT
jgi:hypothetical protein